MGPAQLGCSVRAALGRGGLLIHDHGWTHFQFNGIVEGGGHDPG